MPLEAKFTPEQREAVARARADDGLTPAEIVARGRRGLLKLNGESVGEFDISPGYANRLGAELVQSRRGQRASPLAKLTPDDAIENLRIRLINMADAELSYLERQRAGKRDMGKYRDIVRAVKEAASIQAPSSRPPAPGKIAPGGSNLVHPTGERARGGSTGALLAAHRRNGEAGPDTAAG